ncbi:MAG: hypothetical protein ACHREM_31490, partial [Polyangiales bacterium]
MKARKNPEASRAVRRQMGPRSRALAWVMTCAIAATPLQGCRKSTATAAPTDAIAASLPTLSLRDDSTGLIAASAK